MEDMKAARAAIRRLEELDRKMPAAGGAGPAEVEEDAEARARAEADLAKLADFELEDVDAVYEDEGVVENSSSGAAAGGGPRISSEETAADGHEDRTRGGDEHEEDWWNGDWDAEGNWIPKPKPAVEGFRKAKPKPRPKSSGAGRRSSLLCGGNVLEIDTLSRVWERNRIDTSYVGGEDGKGNSFLSGCNELWGGMQRAMWLWGGDAASYVGREGGRRGERATSCVPALSRVFRRWIWRSSLTRGPRPFWAAREGYRPADDPYQEWDGALKMDPDDMPPGYRRHPPPHDPRRWDDPLFAQEQRGEIHPSGFAMPGAEDQMSPEELFFYNQGVADERLKDKMILCELSKRTYHVLRETERDYVFYWSLASFAVELVSGGIRSSREQQTSNAVERTDRGGQERGVLRGTSAIEMWLIACRKRRPLC